MTMIEVPSWLLVFVSLWCGIWLAVGLAVRRFLLVLAFLLPVVASAENHDVKFFFQGSNWTGGGEGVDLTVRYEYPPGLPNGNHAFYSSSSGGLIDQVSIVNGVYSKTFYNAPVQRRDHGVPTGENTEVHEVYWQNFSGNVGGTATALVKLGEWNFGRSNPQNASSAFTWRAVTQTFIMGGAALPDRAISFGLDGTITKAAESTGVKGPFVVKLFVNGSERASRTMGPFNGTSDSLTFDVLEGPETVPGASFTYSWTVNGATVAGGTVAATDERTVIWDYFQSSEGASTAPPEPDPTPGVQETAETTTATDASGTETATTVTTAPDGSTQTAVVSEVAGGASTALTKQDFYEAFRQALLDAEKQNAANGVGEGSQDGTATNGTTPGDAGTFTAVDDDGLGDKAGEVASAVEDTAENLANARTAMGSFHTSVQAGITAASSVTLPTHTGQTLSGLKVAFRGVEYPVNLSGYSTAISWFRQLQVFIVTVVYWRVGVKLVTSLFAV